MWRVCVHLVECICLGELHSKTNFDHFASCVEPLPLLEGLELFLESFEMLWSFASGVEPFYIFLRTSCLRLVMLSLCPCL